MTAASPTPTAAQRACGFHDAECAGYRADLPLWIALADTAGGRVLDLGAGTGRVAVELAAHGFDVTAVDLDADLLEELERRAHERGVQVQTVAADMSALPASLGEPAPALVMVPMQTIQLLGGAEPRAAFFQGAAAITAAGAELAIAIVPEVEPFDGRGAPDELLPPDIATIDDFRFESVPRAVLQPAPELPIDMHRRRTVRLPDGGIDGRPEDVVITLDAVDASTLVHEGAAAGWKHAETIDLAATDEHAGGQLVTFIRAADRA